MNNSELIQQTFSVRSFSVVKAAYKDSVYYLAGGNDITAYVKRIESEFNKVNVEVLEKGLTKFLKDHPEHDTLQVPLFDFVLYDDPNTSAEFVNLICDDVFHYSTKQCAQVVEELNTQGYSNLGTFTDELCVTFACMIANGNEQLKQNIGFDKIPSLKNTKQYHAALFTLENLIRRDFPDDL